MTPKSVKPHIAFILDTLQVIEENTPAVVDDFLGDRNAQDATLMRLQDIGEQLSRIRKQFPAFYAENHVERWNQLIGLRNIISHGYREIDLEIIWDIVSNELAAFRKGLQEMTQNL